MADKFKVELVTPRGIVLDKMVDGVISTPELDDMHPFLDPKELASIRDSALNIN